MNKTTSLSFALVAPAGQIDREASLKAAADVLDAHIAESATQLETIAEAVASVFDQYKGASLTMPTIEGMTLRALNVQPSNYKTLGKRVLDYVRQNSEEVRKGVAPSGTKLFGTKKGVNGGVIRWSDQTPASASAEAPEASETAESQDSE